MTAEPSAETHFYEEISGFLENDRIVRIVTSGAGITKANARILHAPASLLYSTCKTLEPSWNSWISKGAKTQLEVHIEDNTYDIWQVFLYWLLKREIPLQVRTDQLLLAFCWKLGEEMVVLDFMAEAMLRLMQFYDQFGNTITPEVVEVAFCKTNSNALDANTKKPTDGKHIRILAAEELLKANVTNDAGLREWGLDQCKGTHENCGLRELPDILKHLEPFYRVKPGLMHHRFRLGNPKGAGEWMSRMEGPQWAEIEMLVGRRIRTILYHQEKDIEEEAESSKHNQGESKKGGQRQSGSKDGQPESSKRGQERNKHA